MKKRKLTVLTWGMALALVISSFIGMGPIKIVKADTTSPVNIAAWNYFAAPGNSIVPATTDILAAGAALENFADKIPTYSSSSLCIGNGNGDWSNGANTKYWQITLSTIGYENLTLTAKARSSGTGPRDFKVVYSTDGVNWNDIPGGTYAIKSTILSSFMASPLSLPADAANISNLKLRFIMASNISSRAGTSTYSPTEAVAIGGTSNINNIEVTGTAMTDPPAVVNVSGIALDKSSLSLAKDQTVQLTAIITPSNATNKNVTWTSDNPAVATVANGLVKGISSGMATITAATEDGGFKSLCVITVTANAPPESKIFDIIEITDFHGQLLDSTNTKPIGAALAYVVKNAKASNPSRTLIIGGGDLYQGTPTSNVLQGVPVQQVMSNLGMEVTALGNHEFDWGLDVINNKTMVGANYEIICANMYNKLTNTRVYNPYKIITKDGVRIAVIGAILKDAPTIILPANVANYEFRDAAAEINSAASNIRANNLADVVLVTIHDGGSSLDTIVSNLHGVDAVFGGHTHTTSDIINKDADGKDVPTLNAANAGKGFIDLKITLDASNKIISFSPKGSNWNAVTVTASSPTDHECKKIVDDASQELLPIFNEPIGYDAAAYTNTQVDSPFGESQLGNWMADVVKNYPLSTADVGMVNNGGIRLSPVPAGTITVGTIFNLMPFDNTVCTTTMTGAQLKFILEQAVQDNGKGIQISGVKFAYDSTKPSYKPAVVAADGTITVPEVPGQRVLSITREKDGSLVKDTDILKVNAPDFVATGGDTFTGFLNPAIVNSLADSHYTVRDALIKDVREKGKITVVMNNRVDNQMAVIAPEAMTIVEARATTKKAVILTGTISAVNGNNVFMQDDTAGICVYNSGGKTFSAKKGDKIKVTGNLSTYNGLLEVTPTSAANVILISSGNIVSPKVVTVGSISDALQGQLIKVKNVKFTSIDNSGASMAEDSTGSINVYKMPVVDGLKVGDVADVTAAVTRYGSTLELAVDSPSDVVIDRTPPVITVGQIEDGKAYNRNVVPVITSDDPAAVVNITLNGKPYNGEDITAEGEYQLDVTAVDLAGNSSEIIINFIVDKTAPEINTNISNGDELERLNTFTIMNTAKDTNSGLDMLETTLDGIKIPNDFVLELEMLDFGDHKMVVTAKDKAGNISSKEIDFTVTAETKTLSILLERFYNQGLIKNQGIYNSLAVKLDKGNLIPFKNELLAQKGKGIDEDAVNVLMKYYDWIVSREENQIIKYELGIILFNCRA